MSSDSEDDCYGNIAQKLQSIKNKYEEVKTKTTTLLNTSQPDPAKTVDKVIEIVDNSPINTCEELKDDSDCEEISLDAIIAQNTTKKATRKSNRLLNNTDISLANIIPTRGRKRPRASQASASVDLDVSVNVSDLSEVEPNTSVTKTRGRGRGRQRGRRGKSTRNTSTSNINTEIPSNPTNTSSNMNTTAAASASRSISSVSTSRSTRRGRSRRERQPNRRRDQITLPEFLSAMFGFGSSSFPTFSIGNTDEYPDESYNQPLFTNKPKEDEVVVVAENEPDLNDSLDENEELSVKVYWQSREYVKFTIRRFQKLQSIFDFFADREKVSHDKLFFTYNDKILKMDDTPDSITYNIVKFIDGGVINQSVLKIVQKDQTMAKDGIKLKFQCQNIKKPYEIHVRPEDKLAVAMLRCAEHLEKPLEKLKFLFDGDVITGKNTPKELDLEGGDCIDVKIIS